MATIHPLGQTANSNQQHATWKWAAAAAAAVVAVVASAGGGQWQRLTHDVVLSPGTSKYQWAKDVDGEDVNVAASGALKACPGRVMAQRVTDWLDGWSVEWNVTLPVNGLRRISCNFLTPQTTWVECQGSIIIIMAVIMRISARKTNNMPPGSFQSANWARHWHSHSQP